MRKTRSTGRVTLAHVAQRAGVSPISASRALRGQPGVAAELAGRVVAAARQLGYVPDPAARALASSRGSVVAVLVPSLTNTVFVDLLEAVHDVMLPAGYDVLIGNTHYQRSHEARLLASYLGHRPSGLLLTGFDRSDDTRALIAKSGLPCVHLMELADDASVPSVGLSQQAAAAAVVQHLLARGRRRVAFVAAQLDPRTLQRAEGYRSALLTAGRYDAQLEMLNPAKSSIGMGAELFAQLVSRHPDVDAAFMCNDDLAQGALFEALRRGLAVPQQIAVVGFNDLEGSAHCVPRLTTVRTPRALIGSEAAQMLLKLIRGEPVADLQVDVGFELVVRESG
jgi:LacI family gluconate utilization system Gnt-I transcriptional repressor